MTQPLLLIRVNCPDDACAVAIGETLIKKRLTGCINIDGPVESVYMWEGEMEHEEEYVLWIKAREDDWADIEALVLEMHPHEIPAILAIPCVKSNARYAEWLDENTKT